jgi:quercetin dioxygenase-like cupin family protein
MSQDNPLGIEPIIKTSASIHRKGWGEEVWICNSEKYCGKLLRFNKGAEFSMHYHMLKHETFYVLHGSLTLKGINLNDASPYECELGPGSILVIPAGNPHKIIAHEASTIIEISTQHFESDSYRIQPGNSQKK